MLEIRPNLKIVEFKMDGGKLSLIIESIFECIEGYGVVKCSVDECYNFMEPTQENIAKLFTKKEI